MPLKVAAVSPKELTAVVVTDGATRFNATEPPIARQLLVIPAPYLAIANVEVMFELPQAYNLKVIESVTFCNNEILVKSICV